MARQLRFVLPGQLHLIRQAGHNACAIEQDAQDRQTWLAMLRDVAATHRVVLQGWALQATEFRLLVTPSQANSLALMIQHLGRRYVGYFNARHGRSGTLWEGRYRCVAIQPGERELIALAYVEQLELLDAESSSRAHHLGLCSDPSTADSAAYWALGNTPFERHAAWFQRLAQGLSATQTLSIERALRSGIPLASEDWLRPLQAAAPVKLFPRPRGRPRRQVPGDPLSR